MRTSNWCYVCCHNLHPFVKLYKRAAVIWVVVVVEEGYYGLAVFVYQVYKVIKLIV